MKKLSKISVIVPTFNEKKSIEECLNSLDKQSQDELEIIVVDDGSVDGTRKIVDNLKHKIKNLKLLKQNHLGPGPARNFGAEQANGEILVFVDADMTFDRNFISDLIKPIFEKKTIGTFSKNEMNANPQNIWSKCWQINRNWPLERLIPPNFPDKAPVYRAILKREFQKVGGFDTTGEYTDDWSLARKLKKESTLAPGAFYYHENPDTLSEVFAQAKWIGKNSFIVGNLIRKLKSLFFYSLPTSLIIGVFKSATNVTPSFIVFKIVYDFGIFISVIQSFFSQNKSR